MDMEELGYFIYMNEMEQQKATSSDLFGNSSDSEDDEDE